MYLPNWANISFLTRRFQIDCHAMGSSSQMQRRVPLKVVFTGSKPRYDGRKFLRFISRESPSVQRRTGSRSGALAKFLGISLTAPTSSNSLNTSFMHAFVWQNICCSENRTTYHPASWKRLLRSSSTFEPSAFR